MAEQKIWLGSVGPLLYDDSDLIGDADGDLSGEAFHGFSTTGAMIAEDGFEGDPKIGDIDGSNRLTIDWNEDDSSDRTLSIKVSGANRTVTFTGSPTIGGGQVLSNINVVCNNDQVVCNKDEVVHL